MAGQEMTNHIKVSYILFADDIHIDISRIIIEKALQFLLDLLHLFLIAQAVEDVHRALEVHPCITDFKADVDGPQQFQSPGQL